MSTPAADPPGDDSSETINGPAGDGAGDAAHEVRGDAAREVGGDVAGHEAGAAGEMPGDRAGEVPGKAAGEAAGYEAGAGGEVAGEAAGEVAGGRAGEVPGNAAREVGGEAAGNEAGAGEAARRARAERAVRGTLAAALCLEALTVLFVPRAIAPVSDGGLTGGRLAVLLGLAAALLVAAGLQRFRAGIVVGSGLQVAVLATGVLTAAMYVLGLLFGAVWIYLLRVRRELTGAGRPGPTP